MLTIEPNAGVLFTSDHQEIHYDHYRNGHRKIIVIAHGFFNSKEAVLLKMLAGELIDEYDVLVMDFRGHGKSKGVFYWTAKEHLDMEAVLRYVRQTYVQAGVIGFSLGAATSIIAAARTDLIDSLISVSAPVEFEKIDYRFWELDVENDIYYNLVGEGRIGKGVRPGPFWLKKDKPGNLVDKIKIPVLYIHGEADWLIKPFHSEKLFKNTVSKKRLVLIKNGPHAEYLLRKDKEETLSAIKEWFPETLAGGNG